MSATKSLDRSLLEALRRGYEEAAALDRAMRRADRVQSTRSIERFLDLLDFAELVRGSPLAAGDPVRERDGERSRAAWERLRLRLEPHGCP